MKPPTRRSSLEIDRGGRLSTVDDDGDESAEDILVTARPKGAPAWAPPSNDAWRDWLQGRTTVAEFIGLGQGIADRIAKLEEFIKRERQKGSTGSELARTLDSDASARTKWTALRAVREAPDALRALEEIHRTERHAVAREKLREFVWDQVSDDAFLDLEEQQLCRNLAYKRGLAEADYDWAVETARARLQAEQKRALKIAAAPTGDLLPLASARRYGFPSEPRSMAELHALFVADNNFEHARRLLEKAQVTSWLDQNREKMESDKQRERLEGWVVAAEQAEANFADPGAIWEFLWRTGYRRLHLPSGQVETLDELRARTADKPEQLEGAVQRGDLARWCRFALDNEELADVAVAGDRTPREIARLFLWAAGVDALPVGRKSVRSPAELRELMLASQADFNAVVQLVGAGRSIQDWLAGLAFRSAAVEIDARIFAAARKGPNEARETAYGLLFALGADALPIWGRHGRTLVRGLDDMRAAVRGDPQAVAAIVTNGGLAAWFVVNGAKPGVRKVLRDWYAHVSPSAQRAAEYVLLCCGAPEIAVGPLEVRNAADLRAAYESDGAAFVRALKEGALQDWITRSVAAGDVGIGKATGVASQSSPQPEIAAPRIAWSVGSTSLWMDGVRVSSAEELRNAADAQPDPVSSRIAAGLIGEYLVVLGLPDIARELGQLPPAQQWIGPSRLAEMLGADPARLVPLPAVIDGSGIAAGSQGTVDLTFANAAPRGRLIVTLTPIDGGHVSVTVPTTSIALGPSDEQTVRVTITVAANAPPGTLLGDLGISSTGGDDLRVGVRVRRSLPWAKFLGEVGAHVLICAITLAFVRTMAGGLAEAQLTAGGGLATSPIVPNVPCGLVVALPLGLGAAFAFWTNLKGTNRDALPWLGCLGLCGFCVVVQLLGALAVLATRAVDGAAVPIAQHVWDLSAASALAPRGWGVLGAGLGLTTGTQQAVTRHYGVGLGVAAGIVLLAVMVSLVGVASL